MKTAMRKPLFIPPGPTVTVINTSANPVPTTLVGTSSISGTVVISNVPTVNAQQSGAWNVGILGTPSVSLVGTPVVSLAAGGGVSVANAVDGSGNPIPLLIRDADNPARQPFITTCQGLTPMSANNLGTCSFTTVPAGKRFVVETATGGCQAPSGSKLFQLAAGVFNSTSGREAVISVLPVITGPFNGTDNFVMNSSQRFYVDPGDTPGFSFGSTDTSGSTFCFFTLSGYLINLP